MARFLPLTFVLLLSAHSANARFSAGFHDFLTHLYGEQVAEQLERPDLNGTVAFGGGNTSLLWILPNDPIVLVHANKHNASAEVENAQFFEANGFQAGSVFATSWGPNGTTMSQKETLHCDYVKQVRRLIVAVHLYTQRRVIVGAQSLGSAVSRKALLGGECVDTGENLGFPLTSIVRVFFSQHYEAEHVYVVASQTDEAVTYPYIAIPGANINISGFSHQDTQTKTMDIQLEMINTNHLTNETLQKDVGAGSELTGKTCTGSVQQ
ncbi:hypothetical protein M3Y99_00681900 [Aphelenchoides fujianensis]|nr:hypothetical protein M3Y99_00681900 [Aphelenchoides fujianensis]